LFHVHAALAAFLLLGEFSLLALLVPALQGRLPFLFPRTGPFRIGKARNGNAFGTIRFENVSLRINVHDKAVSIELQRHGFAIVIVVVVVIVSPSGARNGGGPSVVLGWVVVVAGTTTG